MTKRTIWKQSDDISQMNGEQVVEALDNFCKLNGKTRKEVSIERDYGEYHCYITFSTTAMENDEEYAARLAREAAREKAIEDYRRKQYEDLKKEFEK